MASDFEELCRELGLSPGDPNAIDKIINVMENTGQTLSCDEIEFYLDQGFVIDEDLLPDD